MSANDSELLKSVRLQEAVTRLMGLLPATIRTADVGEGNPLAALITALATGAVELDEALDAMADNAFVETADAAALEDLAQLVGATPLAPLPAGSGYDQRAYVANTLANRAGKGTARALEQLATDVGGFGTVVVEYFQRLVRTENLIDVRVDRPGVAAPRAGITGSLTATAFDRLPRLPDFRSIARAAGRHHVPNVGVHLLRLLAPVYPAPADAVPPTPLPAAAMAGVPRAAPWTGAAGLFRLAGQPNGVVRLFNPDRRSSDNGARPNKTSLPDRLARLPLHLETRELRRAKAENRAPQLDGPPWFAADAPFTLYTSLDSQTFRRIPPQELRIVNFESVPTGRPFATADGGPVSAVIDPVTGRIALPAPAAGQPDVKELRVAYAYGIARAMAAGPHERDDATVPASIVDKTNALNFIRIVDATAAAGPVSAAPLRTVPSLAAALADWALTISPAQWTAVRYAVALFVLTRCDREAVVPGLALAPGVEHHVVAAQWQPFTPAPGIPADPGRRGFIVRTERRAILDAQLTVTAAPAVRPDETAGTGTLILDGLELTAGLRVDGGAGSSLRIRHCTLRNPGAAALATAGPLKGGTITVENTICGPLALADPAAAGTLALTNCIVSADGANAPAVSAGRLDGNLLNITLLGTSSFRSLEATNVLFTDTVTAERTQEGCVRYSYIANCYTTSSVPRRYRCQPDLARAAAHAAKGSALTQAEAAEADLSVEPLFLDTGLEEPTCAVLHTSASDGLRLGGEGQAEMGAFAVAAQGLRMANVVRLFPESLPVALEAGLIDDTRSSAAARRRNVP